MRPLVRPGHGLVCTCSKGMTGVRYDAVDKVLHMHPSIKGDFRSFFAAGTAYGTAGVKDGRPFIDLKHGSLDIRRIDYKLCGG